MAKKKQEQKILTKESPKNPMSKAMLFRIIGFALVGLILIGAILFAVHFWNQEKTDRLLDVYYDGSIEQNFAFDTTLDAKEQAERVKQVKRHGDTGKFDFYCYDTLNFSDGSREASIIFGNVSKNDCILALYLVNDLGDMIYHSKGIEPGKYLSRISCSYVPSEEGVYDAKLYVVGYDPETLEKVGIQYVDMKLNIGEVQYD